MRELLGALEDDGDPAPAPTPCGSPTWRPRADLLRPRPVLVRLAVHGFGVTVD
jgi:hypothetical protein